MNEWMNEWCGGSQPSETPVLGISMPSSAFCEQDKHGVHTHRQNTYTYIYIYTYIIHNKNLIRNNNHLELCEVSSNYNLSTKDVEVSGSGEKFKIILSYLLGWIHNALGRKGQMNLWVQGQPSLLSFSQGYMERPRLLGKDKKTKGRVGSTCSGTLSIKAGPWTQANLPSLFLRPKTSQRPLEISAWIQNNWSVSYKL